MTDQPRKTFTCAICGKERRLSEMFHAEMIHGALREFLLSKAPACAEGKPFCLSCLNRLRAEFVEETLQKDRGEISELESDVVRSMREQELMSRDVEREFD